MDKWSILIVDDEMPAREKLINIVDWDKTNFNIKDTAINGQDALNKLCGVDIIITDIQMPVMDGLELIKQVKKSYPAIKIVVLSCHEEFRYAKEAMKYGVNDYLVKDMITPADLMNALKRLESQRSNHIANDSNKNLAKDYYKGMLRRNIIAPQSSLEEISIEEALSKLSLTFDQMVVFSILLDNRSKTVDDYRSQEAKLLIKQVSDQLLKLTKAVGGFYCYDKKFRFLFIGNMNKSPSKLFYLNECYQLSDKIRTELSLIGIDSVTIGISNKCVKPSELPAYYIEALTCSKQRVFYGYDKNIYYDNLLSLSLSKDIDFLKDKLDKIKLNLMNHRMNDTLNQLKQLYSKDIKGYMQYNYLKYVNYKIFEFAENYCLKYDIDMKEIFIENFVPYDYVDSMDTTDEMHEYFKKMIKRMMIDDTLSRAGESKYGLKVNQAIQILQKNYRKNIKLEDVAISLSLHKVYLSRIFKEETGVTIGQYTQKLVVDDAMKLLVETHLKVYEIANTLGYGEGQTDQFNGVFKRLTGLTPTKYRKKYYMK